MVQIGFGLFDWAKLIVIIIILCGIIILCIFFLFSFQQFYIHKNIKQSCYVHFIFYWHLKLNIFLQISTCSLWHRFQHSAHIHPVSLVLLFFLFCRLNLSLHCFLSLFFKLCSVLSLKWFNSLLVCHLSLTVSHLTFFPQSI